MLHPLFFRHSSFCCATAPTGRARGSAGNGSGRGSKAREGRRKVTLHIALCRSNRSWHKWLTSRGFLCVSDCLVLPVVLHHREITLNLKDSHTRKHRLYPARETSPSYILIYIKYIIPVVLMSLRDKICTSKPEARCWHANSSGFSYRFPVCFPSKLRPQSC